MKIITTHKNADFDALASTIAGTILYPEAVPVLPKTLNPNVKAFLSLHKDLLGVKFFDEIDPKAVSALVVVDANRWDRLPFKKSDFQGDQQDIILFDHHLVDSDIGAGWRCEEAMGANVTLMVRILRQERKLLTPIQATLLLSGIYEDTGNLTFSSTTPEDAYSAAWLLERKADLGILGNFLRPVYREKHKDTLFEMLRDAERIKINGIPMSFNKTQISGYVDNLAVVVHMYREVLNVDVAFGIFFDSQRGACLVIGRSINASVNVGALMRGIGGGGHPGAGSAMLKSASPEAVEEMLRELIAGNQPSSIQISDIMSFPVISIHERAPMAEAAGILRRDGVSGLPVVNDNDELVGILSRRDFKKVRDDRRMKAPVKAYMNETPVIIEPGKSPVEAAGLMIKHDIGRLPVVENGRMIGIVTRSDTMLYFYDMLPD